MNDTSFTTNSLELAQLVEFGEAEACADMQLAAAASLGTRVRAHRFGDCAGGVADPHHAIQPRRRVGPARAGD